MTRHRTIAVFVLGLLLAVTSPPAHALTITGGGVVTVDYPLGSVIVEVDRNRPAASTTLHWLRGANAFIIRSYGTSKTIFDGGTLTIDGSGLCACLVGFDSSIIEMRAGSITADLIVTDSSRGRIVGGLMNRAFAQGTAQLDISGGGLDTLVVKQDAVAHLRGIETWYSGGQGIIAEDNGKLTIHGTSFELDGVPMAGGSILSARGGDYLYEPTRRLAATLADGSRIEVEFRLGNESRLVLVPEPGTAALVGAGLALLAVRTRR